MKFAYLLSGALLSAAITFASSSAQAQAHDLYFAQTGAALTYSFAETRVLYNAMSSRFYDENVVSETLEDLKRALASAERNTERAMARLPKKMKKFAPKLARLKKAIGRGEQSLSRVETDIEEQTAPDLESPSELGEPLNGNKDKPAKVDWRLLKTSVSWLAQDIRSARELYKQALMNVARPVLRAQPPRPRGRRPK